MGARREVLRDFVWMFAYAAESVTGNTAAASTSAGRFHWMLSSADPQHPRSRHLEMKTQPVAQVGSR